MLWALEHGADVALVFPMHVKPHTLLEWLATNDRYRPPSLWSLVEVLTRIEPGLLPRVSTSWYRSDYGAGSRVLLEPTTCERCRRRVVGLLDRFREALDRATVAALAAQTCTCRDVWREEVETTNAVPLPERVIAHYDLLARSFGLDAWWQAHRTEMVQSLQSSPGPARV